jgi:hypothetical protein
MNERPNLHFVFVRRFLVLAGVVWQVLAAIVILIGLGGVAISVVENLPLGRAIYFAFITGLTIGYGDITPQTSAGAVLSVILGLIGTVFVGLTVAIAVRALRDTVNYKQDDSSPS